MDNNKQNTPTLTGNPFASLNLSGVEDSLTNNIAEINQRYSGDASSPDQHTPAAGENRRPRTRTQSITGAGSERGKSQKRKKEAAMSKSVKKSRATDDGEGDEMEVGNQTSSETTTSGDPFARMQAFMEQQFKNTNENIRKMNNSIVKVNEKVGVNTRNLARLRQTVDDNSDNTDLELQKLHSIVREREDETRREIDEMKKTIKEIAERAPPADSIKQIRSRLEEMSSRPSLTMASPELERDNEYMRARKSIRIWLAPAREGQSVIDAARQFMKEKFSIPHSSLEDIVIEQARKVAQRKRRAKQGEEMRKELVHDEVLVRFSSVNSRDYVMSHASNLGTWVGDDNMPTAGARLEIPAHLLTDFNDLLGYGRMLRIKHGEGFKRQVKFDDKNKALYMDVRLPSAEEWLLVDVEMAQEHRSSTKAMRVRNAREKLGGEPSVERPETGEVLPEASTSTSGSLPRSNTLQKFNKNKGKKSADWE